VALPVIVYLGTGVKVPGISVASPDLNQLEPKSDQKAVAETEGTTKNVGSSDTAKNAGNSETTKDPGNSEAAKSAASSEIPKTPMDSKILESARGRSENHTLTTLQRGATGPNVTALQQILQGRGFPPGNRDGVFGLRTEAAVLAFQKGAGLLPDGIAGPQTLAALRRAQL
jgi:peptidoglycan hydrolase-like protein with peptidoglycan-binding domain